MPFVKPPSFITRTMQRMTWSFYGDHRKVYLTFDDGPTPEVTPWVLKTLAQYNAAGTFFCLGRNVDKFPLIYRQILSEDHAVGNHTYSHLKGFRASTRGYLDDVALAGTLINSKLFRPPYGRILPKQLKALNEKYRVIMWDVLSFDYNRRISGERVVKNVLSKVKPGSIIVFHDSDKARENLYYALPRVLDFLKMNNFEMERIPENGIVENGIPEDEIPEKGIPENGIL